VLTIDLPPPLSLTNDDVLVSIDKRAFIPVSTLQSASSAPLDFILVVDSSSSAMRSSIRTTALRETAKFIAALRTTGITVRAAVVEFNASPRIVQNLTDEPIESGLERLSPGGGSTLHDALTIAAQIAQQSSGSTRRVIFVVSDGEDNLSNATPNEVVQAAIRSGAQINALSLGEPPRQYAPIRDGEINS